MGERAGKLTARQERFVQEFLIDLNSSAAATRSGYKGDPNTTGPRLLQHPGVAAEIAKRQAVLRESLQVTQEMIVRELAKIAFGDQRQIMSWGKKGIRLRESVELTDDQAAAVAEISETVTAAGGTLKVKTHDKVGALKLLGDHLGMFRQKVEHSGPGGQPLPAAQLAPVINITMPPEAK